MYVIDFRVGKIKSKIQDDHITHNLLSKSFFKKLVLSIKLLLSKCGLYRDATFIDKSTFIDKPLFFLLNVYDKYYGFSRIFFYS